MACLGAHFAITADVVERLPQDQPLNRVAVIAWLEDLDRHRALARGGWPVRNTPGMVSTEA